ncbi:SPOR domain-containing protein [Humibacter sp. BT305]|nr:SPOR domain-containing protein [Humibacter sp. BT305]
MNEPPEDTMAEDPSTQYWYNMKTGEVEQGYVSSVVDRVGPFATREEASHALEKLRENSEKWAEDDARENR